MRLILYKAAGTKLSGIQSIHLYNKYLLTLDSDSDLHPWNSFFLSNECLKSMDKKHVQRYLGRKDLRAFKEQLGWSMNYYCSCFINEETKAHKG